MKQLIFVISLLLFGSTLYALPKRCVHKDPEIKWDDDGHQRKHGAEWRCQDMPNAYIFALMGVWKNGKKHGEWVSFYENGIRERLITYKDGLEHGWSAAWDEDGLLSAESEWKNGEEVLQ